MSLPYAATDPLAVHRLHLLLLLGGWLVVAAVWQGVERLAADQGPTGRRLRQALPGVASPRITLVVLVTAVSALIHLAVSPEHFRESTDYGVFFLALATGQLAWSLLLLRRPSTRLLRLGGLVSVAVVLLWLETRAVGLGFGPLAAGREALGVPDLVSTAAELWLVVVALQTSRPRTGPRVDVPA